MANSKQQADQLAGVREQIILALDYPKAMMNAAVKLQRCDHEHHYGGHQDCDECLFILECQCTSEQLLQARLQNCSDHELTRMLKFGVEYISYHIQRQGHLQAHCDCDMCNWLKATEPLLCNQEM